MHNYVEIYELMKRYESGEKEFNQEEKEWYDEMSHTGIVMPLTIWYIFRKYEKI